MSEITDIHRPFIDWLRKQGIPYVNSRSDKESTICEGHPDFTLLLANRCMLLEMKTEKGKLRLEQVKRIAELEAAGCRVHVIRDLQTAIEIVTAWRSMLGEPSAVPKSEPALVKWGEGVFRSSAKGWIFVRVATPKDDCLPKL